MTLLGHILIHFTENFACVKKKKKTVSDNFHDFNVRQHGLQDIQQQLSLLTFIQVGASKFLSGSCPCSPAFLTQSFHNETYDSVHKVSYFALKPFSPGRY